MNNTSPLVPQGAIPPRPKNSLYFKILMVLSLHVVIIGGMLLQGCKDTSTASKPDAGPTVVDGLSNTNTPTTSPITNDMNPLVSGPGISNQLQNVTPFMQPISSPTPTSMTATVTGPALILPSVPKEAAPVAAAPVEGGKDYVIAKGDTLAVIAHKNGVSLKALEEANPGVNPKKLHVGQKVQIPGAGSAVASTAGAMKTAEISPSGEGDLYVVKSGDTLSKIAKLHGVSYKKIMAMNELKTTSIHAGQKLKLPAAKASTAEPATPTTTTPAAAPAMKVSSVATPAAPIAKN